MRFRCLLALVALALASGCSAEPDPLTSRAFWRDADRVEALTGLSAVPIEAGEPLWDFPLVTVTRDAIRFDGRPWLASVDRAALPPGALEQWSFEVPLQDGAVPEDQLRGVLIVPLFDAAKAWEERTGYATVGAPWIGFNLLPERDVPAWLVKQVEYSLGQAQLFPPVLVGRVGAELRGAQAGRAEPHYRAECAAQLDLLWIAGGRYLLVRQEDGGRYLTAFEPGSMAAPLAELSRRCVESWDAAAAALAPSDPPVDPAAWRCLSVRPWPEPDAPVEELLTTLGEGYALDPVVFHYPLGASGSPSPDRPAPSPSTLDDVDLEAACGLWRIAGLAVGEDPIARLLGTTGAGADGDAVKDLLSDSRVDEDIDAALRSTGVGPAVTPTPAAQEVTP